ncbi:hypothetical protein MBLNU457_6428t1 [Dothideomycetes sp. NU457]
MAAVNYANPASSSMAQRNVAYQAPRPAASGPPGTFAPGTKVQVGSHRVLIEKYLSEGGFAHVYVVRVPTSDNKHEVAVLKRVAVPDKEALASMRTEVETMKKLQGHKRIVKYMDSHASQMKGGGYEVFLLMELCAGGGLIDFMNTRLQHRLTEPEILQIFGDVAEGVATMHYLNPPLLHRDLKVENVLISKPPTSGSGVVYKLCDFGSTAPPRPAAANAAEARLIEEDVQKHTTMQYRSPEMVDVWRRQPIDEKSDIWALGVLLYKLCYYTTPFEEVGTMAILNATFKYPPYPQFSTRLKSFIGAMLMEDPKKRPNIYQVVSEVCSMRGTKVPIKDIYSDRTQSETRSNQQLPDRTATVATPPPVGISHSSPRQQTQALPDIQPMRRGRPTTASQSATAAKPAASSSSGDPFAALDSSSIKVRSKAVDDLASKFPSLEDFSIATDKRSNFQFGKTAKPSGNKFERAPTESRVLADEVFASTRSTSAADADPSPPSTSRTQPSSASASEKTLPPKPAKFTPKIQPPTPAKSSYVSTGTNPSPTITDPPRQAAPNWASRPVWRVPSTNKPLGLPPAPSPSAEEAARRLQPSLPPTQRPPLTDVHKSKSLVALNDIPTELPPRPSLDDRRRSSHSRTRSISRSKSTSRSRPVSATYVDSNLDFLRDHERESSSTWKRPSLDLRRPSRENSHRDETAIEDNPIQNDTDYLRRMEADGDRNYRSNIRSKSTSRKRESMPSIGRLAGRFGDALQRLNRNSNDDDEKDSRQPPPIKTLTPPPTQPDDQHLLSPISGSDATTTPINRMSDVAISDSTDELSSETRRDLERQKLAEEERRVAEAAAEHRSRGERTASSTRAKAIQNRVQAYLSQEGRQPPVKKTAEGYGRYTGSPADEATPSLPADTRPPEHVRAASQPAVAAPYQRGTGLDINKQRQPPIAAAKPAALTRTGPRPSAKPKPAGLRTGLGSNPTGRAVMEASVTSSAELSPSSAAQGSRLAALLAKDQEGVASPKHVNSMPEPASFEMPAPSDTVEGADQGDWEVEFSKRFPNINLDMVEQEIGELDSSVKQQTGMRFKDV